MPLLSIRRALRALLLLLVASSPAAAGELEIHFIRVGNGGSGLGQGAAAFVRGPDGTRVLIDGGNPGDGLTVVRPYLIFAGVTDLDYSFLTHWHLDHLGGMPEVFNGGLKPNVAAYDRGDWLRPGGSTISSYLASVSGVRKLPVLGETIALGDGATIEVVALNGQTIGGTVPLNGSEPQFENAASLALLIRYGDFECYVAGDMTAGGTSGGLQTPDVESVLAAAIGQVEVVQSSHHGSVTSSSQAVVDALDPSFVVHSCGLDNPFFHPHKSVTNRWNSPSASRVQWSTTAGDTGNGGGGFTSAEGAIVVRTDGKTFSASRASGSLEIAFTTFENPGTPPAPGDLAVSEVLVDPLAVLDLYGEWFELVGLRPEPSDLSGVRFLAGGLPITLRSRVLLEQGQRIVVGVDGRPTLNGGAPVQAGLPWGMFSLPNSFGTLSVLDPAGGVVDSLTWGSGAIPSTPGVAQERVDLFAGTSPSNFAAATSSFGAGDMGTPDAVNGADATSWPAGLWATDPEVGGTAELHLSSLDEPLSGYGLGLSGGTSGFPFLGLWVPLAPDPILLGFLASPGALGSLDGDARAQVDVQIPPDPVLSGLVLHASFLTLDFGPLAGKKVSNPASFTVQ